ncbi:MAG: hypothetical protein ACRED1_06715 [Limisphaerales bacterium]
MIILVFLLTVSLGITESANWAWARPFHDALLTSSAGTVNHFLKWSWSLLLVAFVSAAACLFTQQWGLSANHRPRFFLHPWAAFTSLPRGNDGHWNYKLKLSEQSAKVTNPGIHQVRRFRSDTEFVGDGIYDLQLGAPENFTIVDPLDPTRRKRLPPGAAFEDLLVPVFAQGRQVYQPPPLADIRRRTQAQLGMFHSGVKRFINPHQYPVGLELGLHELKMKLAPRAREKSSGP